MSKVSVPLCGSLGVVKDLGIPDLPMAAWTDASNVRFIDGGAQQFLGHGSVFDQPPFAPQFVMPVYVQQKRYWIYATQRKQYAVSNSTGETVHNDITHAAPHTGSVNEWSGTVFGGIPILNTGEAKAPMYWDQDLAHKFLDLPAWPADTSCKVIRSFKNLLVAINITKAGINFPFMVKWSSLADPGALPATWDIADPTKDAGEFDIGEGQDPIVDALGLKDNLIVYKQSSTHAIAFVGGQFILNARKVFGMSGLLNINCAVEFDAFHFAVTGSDVVIHDGFNATSVLDKRARRFFFQDIDATYRHLTFCFKNPFLNEIFVAYPKIGSSACDKALVYNFVDKTVTFRELPNLSHAAYGAIDGTLGGTWNQDGDSWDSDLTQWNAGDFTPDTARVLMASADSKLLLLDASSTFDGVPVDSFIEKRGIDFGEPEFRHLATGIRPRIAGNVGETVIIKVGFSDDPYAEPVYQSVTFGIGVDLQADFLVDGRYLALRIESGSARFWRLDSYDWVDVLQTGKH